MYGSSSVPGPLESGADTEYDTQLRPQSDCVHWGGWYKCSGLQEAERWVGLSRQVCLLSEGWFDLDLGWVDFNRKERRAVLA